MSDTEGHAIRDLAPWLSFAVAAAALFFALQDRSTEGGRNLGALEVRIDRLESAVASLEGGLGDLGPRVDQLEGLVGDWPTDRGPLATAVVDTRALADRLATDVSQVAGRVSATESTLDAGAGILGLESEAGLDAEGIGKILRHASSRAHEAQDVDSLIGWFRDVETDTPRTSR